MEAVSEPGRAPEGRFGVATDPDRDVSIHRLGLEANLWNAVKAAVVRRPRFRKELLEQLKLLVGTGAPMVEWHAEDLEFLAHPADAHAQDSPAAGQHVEGRDALGRFHRRPVAEDQHRRAELQPFRAGRDVRQCAERVQPGEAVRRREAAVRAVGVA